MIDSINRELAIKDSLCAVIFLLATFFAAPSAADAFTYVKLGYMHVDVPSKSNPVNLALNLGYELDSSFADTSLVAEINRTVDSGRNRLGEDLEFESNGLYLVFRSSRSLFASFRIGMVENKIIQGSSSERSDGFALGGNIGIVIGRTRLQLEYTSIATDANFFSLGLEF